MRVSVFSCSLNPMSRSFLMAKQVVADLEAKGADARIYDLREHGLNFCGESGARDNPALSELRVAVREASAIIVVVPIYNFYVNAATKNLIELTGKEWLYKLVGFICAGGSDASYTSVMSIANSLMPDFRCMIVPRFVYATSGAFGNDRTVDMYIKGPDILERIEELAAMTHSLAGAIDPIIAELPERRGRI